MNTSKTSASVMSLYDCLLKTYRPNDPIFLNEIVNVYREYTDSSALKVSENSLRPMVKILCDQQKLRRFAAGIYYIPSVSRLKKGSSPSPTNVAKCRYIGRTNQDVTGYFSGYTFANQLGISTQVPQTLEIVSNKTSKERRELTLGGQRIILRKSRVEVTSQNCEVLQFLDLLKDMDEYADGTVANSKAIIQNYIRASSITRRDVDKYIRSYPDKAFRMFYQLDLYPILQ